MPLCQSEKRTATDPHKCQRWAEQKKQKRWKILETCRLHWICRAMQPRAEARETWCSATGQLPTATDEVQSSSLFCGEQERHTDTVPNRTCITGRCGGCSTAFRRKDSSTLPMLAPEQCRLDRPRVASSQHLVPAPQATKPLKRTQDKRFQSLRRSVQTS